MNYEIIFHNTGDCCAEPCCLSISACDHVLLVAIFINHIDNFFGKEGASIFSQRDVLLIFLSDNFTVLVTEHDLHNPDTAVIAH